MESDKAAIATANATEDVNPYDLSLEKWRFVLRVNAVLNGFIVDKSKDRVQRSRFPAFQLNYDMDDFSAFEIEDNSSINVSILSGDFQSSVVNEGFSTKDFDAVLKAGVFGLGLMMQFLEKFGHVYAKEIHLGGRLQAMKSLESVSGSSITEKIDTMKLEASAQFNPGIARGAGSYQSTDATGMFSNLSISSSLQSIAWEARGGDTTLSSNPLAWAPTVKASHNWRIIRRKEVVPLPDLIGALPEWRHIPSLFSTALGKTKPLPPPGPTPPAAPSSNPLISRPLRNRPSRILKGIGSSVVALAYSPDGRFLAASAVDIYVWDRHSDVLLRRLPLGAVAKFLIFSPDSKMLATAKGKDLQLWGVDSGELVQTLSGHSEDIQALAFSPDGKTLASAGDIEHIRLWTANSGSWRAADILERMVYTTYAMVFLPDSRMLRALGKMEYVRQWDTKEMKAVDIPSAEAKFHRQYTCFVMNFSPDGEKAATAIHDTGDIRVWDVKSYTPLKVLSGHKIRVEAVAFSPDSKLLASASAADDRTAKLWDIESGSLLMSLNHDYWFLCAAFSPDGKTLAVGTHYQIWLCDIE